MTVDLGGTLTLSGDITVSSDWLMDGTFNYTDNGGLTNHGVTFDGAATQAIQSSSNHFYDITISNTAAGADSVYLVDALDVDNDFTLTSGTFRAGNDGFDVSFPVSVANSVTISGGSFNTLEGQVSVGGNWAQSGSGTFNHGMGTVEFTGVTPPQTISGTNTFFFLYISSGGVNIVDASGSTLTVDSTLSVNSGHFKSGSVFDDVFIDVPGTFELTANSTVGSGWTNNGGTFDPGTFKVTFNGAADQLITSGGDLFYDLEINNTGTSPANLVTLADDASVTNDLTITLGEFNTNGFNADVDGDLTIANSAGAILSGTGSFISVAGDWTKGASGVFNEGTSEVFFDGTGNVSASNFFDFTVSADTRTATGALDVNGTVLIDGTGVFVAGAFTHTVAGDWNNDVASGLNATGSTITFDGTSGVANPAANGAFNNMTVAGSVTLVSDLATTNLTVASGTFTTFDGTSSWDVDVNGNVTLTAGTVTFDALVNVAGNFTNNLGGGDTFTAIASTLTFDGTGTQTLGGTAASAQYVLGTVVVNGTANTVDLQTSNAKVEGDLTVTAGTLDLNANTLNQNTPTSDTFTLGAGTTLLVGGASNFPAGFLTYTLNATSTVNYDGAAQTVFGTTYGILTLSGTDTKTAGGATTVAGNLTIGSGVTLADGGFTIEVRGNVANSGSHTGNGKILLANGAATHQLSGTGSYTN
ncbi:MAG: beta strand repeat-containing protein, partial [Bacteroidota bacterium]